MALISLSLRAEGTREFAPGNTQDDTVTNILVRYQDTPTSAGVGYFGAEGDRRIYFYVKDFNREIVTLGLPWRSTGDSGDETNEPLYYRIVSPNGQVVLLDSLASNRSGFKTHNVRQWADAYNGPDIAGVGNGYDTTGYVFRPQLNGNFYIEFAGTRDAQGYQDIPHNLILRNFDITVVDVQGSPQARKGRLWAYRWTFQHVPLGYPPEPGYEDGFDRPFEGKVFVLGDCNYVSAVDFKDSGMRGWQFELCFNGKGPGNTGNIMLDRQSISGRSQDASYAIFLNEPDPSVWPSASAGTIISNPFLGTNGNTCDVAGLFIGIEVSGKGQIEALLDLDGNDGVYTPNTADTILIHNVDAGCGQTSTVNIPWGGIDGLGFSVPNQSLVPIKVNFSQAPTHIMLFDVEYMPQGFMVEQVRPSTGFVPKIYYDDRQINHVNTTNSSPAPKIMLEGCDAPCHTWDSYWNWDGYGQDNTINSWWFTFQEAESTEALISECATLPVRWSALDAFTITEGVDIRWETSTEQNTSHFIVERNIEGKLFEQIAEVTASGNTNQLQFYNWIDRQAYDLHKDKLIYRLKAVDFDGSFHYSPLVEVSTASPSTSIDLDLWPNPIQDRLSISVMAHGRAEVSLRVMDALGRKIAEQNLSASQLIELDTEQ